MKLERIKRIFALAMAIGASTAFAGPLITDWTYTVAGAFDTSVGATTFTAGGGCTSVTATAISWGDCPVASPVPGSGRSGLDITNTPASGSVQTDGPAVATNTYTHHNNPLSLSNATLTQAHILSSLTLTPTSPVGPSFGPAVLPFTINFTETSNTPPCAAASPPGNPCNDIFVLIGSLNNSFVLDGNTYFVSFFDAAHALSPLSADACIAAGAPLGCIGVTTEEGKDNAFTFDMLITSQAVTVPEPGTMALLGLGILGLGALRRQRG